ncbi:site-specific integrase [Mesomycoplasma hyorhinis]|uniref:site-specific integrase n=1 Tax=Mesomycoplasma hyorhinis TaxID=2100 RepID=UPI001C04A47A|nr:site-specific integrase [Mesomycoplasma hyorhinis]
MKKLDILFHQYFKNWIYLYKKDSIRSISFQKYQTTLDWILKLAPDLKLKEIDRYKYQEILNTYAKDHEKSTTLDFHHHIKRVLLDAFEDGFIKKDPTRNVVIKGKTPAKKRPKFLSLFQLQLLLKTLDLRTTINYDWLILLIAKTGLRYSEAIAVTPADFDFTKQILNISKTWNYKEDGGFLPTKNKSSIRKIPLDWQTCSQFSTLVANLPQNQPIFLFNHKIFNSTINEILHKKCSSVNIPQISLHGLRHTHASILLYAGVSTASVAKRLGHASMNTTERVYLHIINELESKDIDIVMRSISTLIN